LKAPSKYPNAQRQAEGEPWSPPPAAAAAVPERKRKTNDEEDEDFVPEKRQA